MTYTEQDIQRKLTGFPNLLYTYRKERNLLRNGVAKRCGVDHSYIHRLENSNRPTPTRAIVEALANGLDLPILEYNRLLISAGYAPLGLYETNWTVTMQSVLDTLNDIRLVGQERIDYERLIEMISQKFHGQWGIK